MNAAGRTALTRAADGAPQGPGTYVFLGQRGNVLYVGTASNIRRRLRQHVLSGPTRSWLHRRYNLVRDVVWEEAPTPVLAGWREADLIFALQPPYNADPGPRSHRGAEISEPVFIVVTPDGARADAMRFELVSDLPESTTGVYGCFPHLGRGTRSTLGIACSDGYVALLRVLWAAGGQGTHMPGMITRAAPPSVRLQVESDNIDALDAFLSGESEDLLRLLVPTIWNRPDYMQPALLRDLQAAVTFFQAGPQRLRASRAQQAGSTESFLDAASYRALVTANFPIGRTAPLTVP